MDTATTEEKFLHAVELIKNLPKSGNFQPSNDLKLKFYSYFKQATEGPCSLPKPGFWDVVSRAKWDAWARLGTMSKEDAMTNYVDEFVQILKSEPFDENAHSYVHLMGPYIDLAPKEFREMYKGVNGNVPNVSVCNSEAVTENHKGITPLKDQNSENNDSIKHDLPVNGHYINGTTESDSDEFSDFYDNANGSSGDELSAALNKPNLNSTNTKGPDIIQARGGSERRFVSGDSSSPVPGSGNRSNRNGHRGRAGGGDSQSHSNHGNNAYGGASGGRRNNGSNFNTSQDVNETLAYAVLRLQHTMEQVVNRLDSLEALLQAQNTSNVSVRRSFWSNLGISPRAAIFLIIWPFIVNVLMYIAAQKRRRRSANSLIWALSLADFEDFI